MKPCWHCQNTNSCDCAFCGTATKAGWVAGKCRVCKAVAFNRQYAHILAATDTMDRNNYEYHTAADGNKAFRVYIPTKGLE
jgi:hypothetical protein